MSSPVPAWHYVAGSIELIDNIRDLPVGHPIGKAVGLYCVKCDEPCVLRHRLGQFELVHPDGRRCEDFARTDHHDRAIEIILKSQHILMPRINQDEPGEVVSISQAKDEVTVGLVRPDISIVANGGQYFVEITFTHRTGEAKRLYYLTLGVPVMEIDLSSRYGDNTSDEDLKRLVLEVAALRSWLVSPQDVAEHRRLRDSAERNRTSFSDRLSDTVWAAFPEAFQRADPEAPTKTYGLDGQIDLLEGGPYFPPLPRNRGNGRSYTGLLPHKHPDQGRLVLTGATRRKLEVTGSPSSMPKSARLTRSRSDGRGISRRISEDPAQEVSSGVTRSIHAEEAGSFP